MIRFPTVLPVAGFMQAAALEELGSRDAQLSAQKAALEERGAELEAWAAQVSQGSGFRVQGSGTAADTSPGVDASWQRVCLDM
jgi:hypothetical protein